MPNTENALAAARNLAAAATELHLAAKAEAKAANLHNRAMFLELTHAHRERCLKARRLALHRLALARAAYLAARTASEAFHKIEG